MYTSAWWWKIHGATQKVAIPFVIVVVAKLSKEEYWG